MKILFYFIVLLLVGTSYGKRHHLKTRQRCFCPCATATITVTSTPATITVTSTPTTIEVSPTLVVSPSPTTSPVSSDYWTTTGVKPWFIQYTGNLDFTKNVEIYNMDLIDMSQTEIDDLHKRNVKVICYFSAGTYENWRPDASRFKSSELGKSNGWPGEKWLDIRSTNVRNILTDRIILAKNKKCDGVDPDNMDGYDNNSGFPLTFDDQLDFSKFIANTAHNHGLSVSLKNNLDQIPQLVNYFDYAVNEQCLEYSECSKLKPFIDQGKTVFHIEYKGSISGICSKTKSLGFSSILKKLDLDDSQSSCPV